MIHLPLFEASVLGGLPSSLLMTGPWGMLVGKAVRG